MWRDFHRFWLDAKVPVYIVRFEDLVERPEPTLQGLLEFILNVETIEGTLVQKYLKLAVGEQSPQIYKPRAGKANGNFDKFDKIHLDFLIEYAYKYLRMLGFYDKYLEHGADPIDEDVKARVEREIPDIDNFIANFNAEQKAKSIEELKTSDEFNSIYLNYPECLLRNRIESVPLGRTTGRFQVLLRQTVTIVDKDKKPVDPS